MSAELQLRIAGIGGQGVVIAADLLGEAALLAGRQVAGSSRYGSAARGTPVRADLVLSATAIDDPHVHVPDVLIVFSQDAYDLYAPGVCADDGRILYDDPAVTPTPRDGVHQYPVPALQTAMKDLGNRQCANLVLVGALLGVTGLFQLSELGDAIHAHVRERFWDVNLKALQLGFEHGQGLVRG